jgi:metal-sulfur cluster biosynthetic enzyme
MLTETDIRDALRACYDKPPQFRQAVNIVDLGMVESIVLALDPDAPGAGIAGVPPPQALTLTLIAASADEDAQTQLRAQILNRLGGLRGLSAASVHFAAEPVWSVARISPEGRRLLALDFPILNNR